MASNRVAKYNPDLITITVAGVLMSGYADGSFVEITPVTDDYSDVAGTDGEVALSPSNDRRVDVVIKLLQTSQSNTVLSALRKKQLATPNMITFALQVENTLSGGVPIAAGEAWIVAAPPQDFDRTAKAREWKIRCAMGDINIQGA